MKIKKENVESAARALAAMPDGRCFLQWLLARCDVRGPVFTGDLESVCKREALRQLGREVEDLIAASHGRKAVIDIEEDVF
ncbi:MAG: hypothetical protein KHZ29_08860 [Desulfovibrionaceae bacterium]|nr:hypothetical protein [Desulfovibrionaceae bacterium]